ncbi:peptidoglycan-binding domain-containing protein [Nonomuraea sp. NPDC049480]|uniref:peptidoglycan-binding domain-containing protein n=1 Tax=Nonomuraea sp. NPDC049480 TaxID=3364353 RepID=UPI0037B19AC3
MFHLLHARGMGLGGGVDDTVFGGPLEDAICSFQREAGLKVDGVAGPKTWSALVRVSKTRGVIMLRFMSTVLAAVVGTTATAATT